MGGERFSASGLMVLDRGYLDIYPFERWETHTLPPLEEGTVFTPSSLLLHEGTTQPPPLLSEADLIRIMSAEGIGTDATIPEHISKVMERE